MTTNRRASTTIQIVGVFLALTICCTVSAAQRSGRGKLDNWGNLLVVRSGRKIKVSILSLTNFRGRLVEVTDDRIILKRKKKEIEIPRDDVARVLVGQPFNRRKRALKRTGIGAAVGAGAPLYVIAEEGCNCGIGRAGRVVGGGAIVGSIAGALVGLFGPPEYILVYEPWEANHAWRGPKQ